VRQRCNLLFLVARLKCPWDKYPTLSHMFLRLLSKATHSSASFTDCQAVWFKFVTDILQICQIWNIFHTDFQYFFLIHLLHQQAGKRFLVEICYRCITDMSNLSYRSYRPSLLFWCLIHGLASGFGCLGWKFVTNISQTIMSNLTYMTYSRPNELFSVKIRISLSTRILVASTYLQKLNRHRFAH